MDQKKILQEKKKEFDRLISLKKIAKNKSPINNVTYQPSKNFKNMGRLFAQSASPQNLPREFRGAIKMPTLLFYFNIVKRMILSD